MTSIIIHAESKKDISLLKELSKKMGLSAQILKADDREDIGLAQLVMSNDDNEDLGQKEAVAYYKSLNKNNDS